MQGSSTSATVGGVIEPESTLGQLPVPYEVSSTSTSNGVDDPQFESEDDGEGFGLIDLLPDPPTPPRIPETFATYTIPSEFRDLVKLSEGVEEVTIRLVGSHPLWGHHLWNAARTFSTFLLSHPELVVGHRILELGAGGGLPSIVCAAVGARRVVVTDYPDLPLLDNIDFNLDTNLDEERRRRVSVTGHIWGKSVVELLDLVKSDSQDGDDGRYDLLLLSDLVFNHSQHAALISTVNSTLSLKIPDSATSSNPYPSPCILVFYTHHRPHLAEADLAFFPALAESGDGWAYEKVVKEWTGPMFVEDRGDERVRGTVWGWRAWRVGPGERRGERVSVI